MGEIVLYGQGYIELVDSLGNDDRIIQAFTKSTDTKRKIDKELFLKERWKEGHHSPLEHVVFTFYVRCPIFVARQWMRHRTGSYNEKSRRYSSDDIALYMPPVLFRQKTNEIHNKSEEYLNEFAKIYDSVSNLYYKMIEDGVSKEQARLILPVTLMTDFYFTMDLRNLIHFLQLRDSPEAQQEIREYARAIKKLIKPIIPITYKVVFGEE